MHQARGRATRLPAKSIIAGARLEQERRAIAHRARGCGDKRPRRVATARIVMAGLAPQFTRQPHFGELPGQRITRVGRTRATPRRFLPPSVHKEPPSSTASLFRASTLASAVSASVQRDQILSGRRATFSPSSNETVWAQPPPRFSEFRARAKVHQDTAHQPGENRESVRGSASQTDGDRSAAGTPR